MHRPTLRNETLLQAFEWHTGSKPPGANEIHASTSHYARLARLIPSLASLGITYLWLPPGCKANNPQGHGYDCYDLWDLGEFDQKWSRSTKWGSREELANVIRLAHYQHVRIIWDAVLNHKTAGDSTEECWAVECDPEDRRKEICAPLKVEAWLRYEFPGRQERYSSFKWSAEHFNGTDWDQRRQRHAIYRLIDPPDDSRTLSSHSSWTKRLSKGLFRSVYGRNAPQKGKGWASDVDNEHGNNDYLMFSNIDYSHKQVVKDVGDWGEWMMRDVGVNGFRLDATQHVSFSFTKFWVQRVKRASEHALIIGEIWTNDVHRILNWLNIVGQGVHAFDSPLLYNFSRISASLYESNEKMIDLRKVESGALVNHKPSSAVTMVSNHDTQIGQASYTTMLSKHKLLFYTFILLRKEGTPCVFWGDLFGTSGPHSEPAIGLYKSNGKLCSSLCDLITLRQKAAYGEQQDYLDDPLCIGWRRTGTHDRPGCIVLINVSLSFSLSKKKIKTSTPFGGWINVLARVGDLDHGLEVTTDRFCYGQFSCPSMSVAVYMRRADAMALPMLSSIQDLQDLL